MINHHNHHNCTFLFSILLNIFLHIARCVLEHAFKYELIVLMHTTLHFALAIAILPLKLSPKPFML